MTRWRPSRGERFWLSKKTVGLRANYAGRRLTKFGVVQFWQRFFRTSKAAAARNRARRDSYRGLMFSAPTVAAGFIGGLGTLDLRKGRLPDYRDPLQGGPLV